MKTNNSRQAIQGSVLLTTMVIIGIIGFILASYLTLIKQQNRSVMRSQTWNSAIPIVEAGIEEAIAHLNKNGLTNIHQDGWALNSGVYYKSNGMGDGFYEARIDISIPATPTITVMGHAPAPLMVRGGTIPAFYAQTANASTPAVYVSRTVRVTTIKDPLYPKGLIAKGDITWVGNTVSDSFDSADANYSTNGRYDSSKRKDNGSVGSNGGSISMGSGIIFGQASTGPNGGILNGSVGTFDWVANNPGTLQPGRTNNDLNITFPDVGLPYSSAPAPGPGTVTTTNIITTTNNVSSYRYPTNAVGSVTGVWTTNLVSYPNGSTFVTTNRMVERHGNDYTTNFSYNATNYFYRTYQHDTNTTSRAYNYVLYGGNYYLSSLSMSGQDDMIVLGPSTLVVNGPIAMSGQAIIQIAVGGNLEIYSNGNVSLQGNGVQNANNDATKFSLFGTQNTTAVSLGGNASFTGTMYVPHAIFTAGGGGSDQYDTVGSVTAKTITLNGHFNFHYDENLGRNGPVKGYMITSWDEL